MIIFLGNDKTSTAFNDIISDSKNDDDIVVSCQYRHKVPESLLFSHNCVNLHFGKLPEYGGCNSIYWQMKNKEQYAYVTLHYMDNDFDTGDIISFGRVFIDNKTADEVYNELLIEAVELLKCFYKDIIHNEAPRVKQSIIRHRYYKKSAVNFDEVKYIDDLEDANALSYKGKQNPIVVINGREWELTPYEDRINKST